VVAPALLVLTVLLVPGAWAPLARAEGLSVLAVLAGTVLVLSFATVGALIVHFRPGHRLGSLISLAALSHAAVLVVTAYAEWARGRVPLPPAWRQLVFVEFLLWPLAFFAVPLMLLWFPDGRPPGRAWRVVEWVVAVAVAGYAVSRLAPYDLTDDTGLPRFPALLTCSWVGRAGIRGCTPLVS